MEGPRHDDRLEELFFRASDLEPDQVEAFLDEHCAGDAELRRELDHLLLDPDAAAEGWMEEPLIEAALETCPPTRGLPESIGRYTIVGLLGEGGMGTVYEARQQSPERAVALKVVRPGLFSDTVAGRFRREARILGTLHHSGIAHVYEAGATATGEPFLAMELVEGRSLTAFASERALSVGESLALVAEVADAVQHAHEQHVVHRDLKPANILVTDDGHPKVLDFGIARWADIEQRTSSLQTRTGELVGTLSYMSPEQLRGDATPIDARSDVYSLGTILYELLTGRLPHDLAGLPIPRAVRVVAEEEPRLIGSVDPRLRGDVETIVAKAMAKEPGRRYPSAAELAADLRRFLADVPIHARQASSIYHMRKFAARHRELVGGVATAFVALTIGLFLAVRFGLGEAEARHEADAAAAESARAAYRATLRAATLLLRDNELAEAERLLLDAPEELRGWEWEYYASKLDQCIASTRDRPAGEWAYPHAWWGDRRLFFTPDGWIHLFPRHNFAGRFVAWNPETGETLARDAGRSDRSRFPDVSGTLLGLRDPETSEIRIVDARTGRPRETPPDEAGTSAGEFVRARSSTNAPFWGGGQWGRAEVRDPVTDELLGTLPPKPAPGHIGGFFSPDHRRLFAYSLESPRQFLWPDVADPGRRIDVTTSARILHADFSPNGETVATGSRDGSIRLWDASTGELRGELAGHRAGVHQVRFAPDGDLLASASWDGTIRLWTPDAVSDGHVLRGHDSYVYPATFTPDGARVVSGDWDGSVRFWDAASGEAIGLVRLPKRKTRGGEGALAFSFFEDGRRMIVTVLGSDPPNHPIVLDTATGAILATFPEGISVEGRQPPQIVPDEERSRILVTERKYGLSILDGRTYERIGDKLPIQGALCTLFDGRPRRLVTGGEHGLVAVLREVDTLEPVATLRGHTDSIRRAVFHPDGSRLATSSRDGTLRVWDVLEGGPERAPLRVLTGHRGEVWGLAWSPDGRRLASGGEDESVRIWDAETGDELALLGGHTDYVWSVDWSPDGRRLVSGSGDRTVRIWDVDPPQVRARARREHRELAARFEPRVRELFVELGDADAVLRRLEDGVDDADSPALPEWSEATVREREVARQVVLRVALGD